MTGTIKKSEIKIAFFDAKTYDREFFDRENKNYGYEIKYFPVKLSADTAQLAKGYNTLCLFVNDDISSEVIDKIYENGTRLIVMRCAGYNNVDLKAAFKKVHVLRVPEYSPYAVAEHAAALILALNRKVHKAYNRVRDHNFSIAGLMGFDMHGKTAGVIGTGRIGKVMCEILRGFGMKLLAFDRYPDSAFASRCGVEYIELKELYRRSDIISIHCPLTKDNFHMIDADAISQMKPGVILINTSRGQLVDTAALVEGLKNEKIKAAGLDVYEEESEYFFEDKSDEIMVDDLLARLTSFSNVIITSHQGFFTEEALNNIAATTLQNVADYYSGNALKNEICYHCSESPCPKKTENKLSCFPRDEK
ncbi:MAG: hydroxyacid dehydrogenase [Lentisphaerae bacterium GWF2_44_16]|nr:MAG: hydroxyacid dehydrogenase [Lentisphaerae bacterium GWF2_44_16]